MEAVTPPSELAVTLSSLNSACSTRMSYSPPCIRRPRKYFDLEKRKHMKTFHIFSIIEEQKKTDEISTF